MDDTTRHDTHDETPAAPPAATKWWMNLPGGVWHGLRWTVPGLIMAGAAVFAAANSATKVGAVPAVIGLVCSALGWGVWWAADRAATRAGDPSPIDAGHDEIVAAGLAAGLVVSATAATGVYDLLWAAGWVAVLTAAACWFAGRGGVWHRRAAIAVAGVAALLAPFAGAVWSLPSAAAAVIATGMLAQPASTSGWRDDVILALASVCPPAEPDVVKDRGNVVQLSRTGTISRRLQVAGGGGWTYMMDRYAADPAKVAAALEQHLPQFEVTVTARTVTLMLVSERRLRDRREAAVSGGVVAGVVDDDVDAAPAASTVWSPPAGPVAADWAPPADTTDTGWVDVAWDEEG